MYFEGNGVPLDHVAVSMWANIAPENGSDTSPELQSIIAKEINAAQIHSAQKRAKDCIVKNYKGCLAKPATRSFSKSKSRQKKGQQKPTLFKMEIFQ